LINVDFWDLALVMSAPWDVPLRINWRCPGMDLLRALGDEQSALGLTRATLLST
jgi:hypothetical protein